MHFVAIRPVKGVTFLPQASAKPQRNNDASLRSAMPARPVDSIGLNFLTGVLIARDAIQTRTCRSILTASVCL